MHSLCLLRVLNDIAFHGRIDITVSQDGCYVLKRCPMTCHICSQVCPEPVWMEIKPFKTPVPLHNQIKHLPDCTGAYPTVNPIAPAQIDEQCHAGIRHLAPPIQIFLKVDNRPWRKECRTFLPSPVSYTHLTLPTILRV